ncbi:MAG: hypothetical protein AABW75_00250 [Nanoarchaeota archaeon]
MNTLSNLSPELEARLHRVYARAEAEKADKERNKLLEPQKSQTDPLPTNTSNSSNASAVKVTSAINLREYIQVGINGLNGKPVVISCYELQGSNRKNYEEAHKLVLNQSLYVPTPLIFTTHFVNVVEAKNGRKQLLYADASSVSDSEVDEMYKHLTTNYKDTFGGNSSGAWTWLNARFVQGSGDNNMDLETIIGINSDGAFITNKKPLECKILEDCFINLDFNGQGFPKAKSSAQSYSQGENIKFYFPRLNAAAGFFAFSGRAGLGCWNPLFSDSSLGVFACAEGTASQIFGGNP